MANFSGLDRLAVSPDKTAKYTFPFSLTDDPKQRVVLICVPAGTSNKKLTNAALLRRSAQRQGSAVTADTLDEALEMQVDLYSQHVIRGWENVFEKDGAAAPFSVDECKKFLAMLQEKAKDYFVEFVSWAQDLDNFRAANAEAAAKN